MQNKKIHLFLLSLSLILALAYPAGDRCPEIPCAQGFICVDGECIQPPPQQAPWIPNTLIAFLISVSIIAFLYMGGISFNNQTLKTYATDEVTQLIFTAFTILSLAFFLNYIDSTLLPAFAQSAGEEIGEGFNFSEYAAQTARSMQEEFSAYLSSYLRLSEKIGEESSKSGYCYLLGTGYSVITCSGINALRSPITNAVSSLSLALADISAQLTLIVFAKNYAFAVLLPLGIFLRAFNFTRKAGGVLIAISIGFYIVFPLLFIFNEKIVIGQISMQLNDPSPLYDDYLRHLSTSPLLDESLLNAECDPFDYEYGQVASIRDKITGTYGEGGLYSFEPVIFQVYIRAILMTALNLTITLIFIQWLSSILGAQIDVSSLMRLSQ